MQPRRQRRRLAADRKLQAGGAVERPGSRHAGGSSAASPAASAAARSTRASVPPSAPSCPEAVTAAPSSRSANRCT